jgi:hypothetical protein
MSQRAPATEAGKRLAAVFAVALREVQLSDTSLDAAIVAIEDEAAEMGLASVVVRERKPAEETPAEALDHAIHDATGYKP